jgi:NADH-quinone oxidoreductase subunit L
VPYLASIVLAGPFAALGILALVPALRRSGRPAGYVSILGSAISLVVSLLLVQQYHADPTPVTAELLWIRLSGDAAIRFGLLVDGLSVAMLAVVSLVACVVQVYSLGYMDEESPGSLGRYFAYHSLFAFAMLGLVAAHNTLQTYVFWELVGLGSYLLIGFWYHKPEASRAAMKAFWTTRLGDVGFALGVVFLWAAGGTFVFEELFAAADAGILTGTFLTLGVAGLFVGAMGKSAQFPFHIWLPDAMEGPTPVSALIHAATMVAAGVYLMVRISPLLAHAPEVAQWVLGIGVFTAFLAATMALVARDIKRILAFSTVSQLGYMMAAVGAGAATASFFHLTTHAFFKALLFLAAGSMIHAVHTNDIFAMGRLWKKMPFTGIYFAVGGLALSGIWPTAGFFSKDEILIDLWAQGHPLAFWTLLVTAGLTAFYMFRAFFVAYFGRHAGPLDVHESPAVMTVPMGLLALLALGAGLLAAPIAGSIDHSISLPAAHGATGAATGFVPFLGLLAGLLGIALAYLGYQARTFRPARIYNALHPLSVLLERRYFIDEIFEALYRTLYLGLGAVIGWIDRYLIDGVVNLLTWTTYAIAGLFRRTQTGRAQDALYAVAIGILLLALLALKL